MAAVVVFCVVQDRATAAGARRYAALQLEALASGSRLVTVDEVMKPAVIQSVRQGALWACAVCIAGLGAAAVARKGQR